MRRTGSARGIGSTVRVDDRQLLDISASRLGPAKQSRITLMEVLSEHL